MRAGITVEVSEADRARLAAIVTDRNSSQKHVWRARIVLLTADGLSTGEIMRRAGTSKPGAGSRHSFGPQSFQKSSKRRDDIT